MKKIVFFVVFCLLSGMLFNGCNVNNGDYEEGIATRQGVLMLNYWKVGWNAIERDFLEVAFNLNEYLFVNGSVPGSVGSFEIRDGENGVYELYKDAELYYVISTNNKMLADADASWTIQVKHDRMSYYGDEYPYQSLSGFARGIVAQLHYQQDDTWSFQVGEQGDDWMGPRPEYVDMTVKVRNYQLGKKISELPLEISGEGLFYYESNSLVFNTEEPVLRDTASHYEAGNLNLHVNCYVHDDEVMGDVQTRLVGEKDANVIFFKENGKSLMRVAVNGCLADWYQSGTFYRCLEQ